MKLLQYGKVVWINEPRWQIAIIQRTLSVTVAGRFVEFPVRKQRRR